jgi:hypothetical protein
MVKTLGKYKYLGISLKGNVFQKLERLRGRYPRSTFISMLVEQLKEEQ